MADLMTRTGSRIIAQVERMAETDEPQNRNHLPLACKRCTGYACYLTCPTLRLPGKENGTRAE